MDIDERSESPSDNNSHENAPSFDWSKCILCQKNTKEALQCPDIKRSDIVPGAGYHTLTANLLRFRQLNILPAEIDLSLFDEGSGIADTLLKQRGKWHKSCRNRYVNMLKPLVLTS